MIGEQVFDALGRRWRIYLGNAAQCLVEQQHQRGFFAVLADALPNVDPVVALAVGEALAAGKPVPSEIAMQAASAIKLMRLSVLRDLVWAGLQKHHPGTSPDTVSDMTDELGFQRFGEIVGQVVRASQAQREVGDAAPGKVSPPAAT